jgi:uncharacterized membrane protein YphA (DoxX/SURF4 family)
MTSTTETGGTVGRGTVIALWTIKGLLALVFLYAGGAKLLGTAKMVIEFGELGLGQAFRYLTGAVEIIGTILLFIPGLAFPGAILLIGVCGGALIAQLSVLHHDVIHVFVLGILALIVAWFHRPGWLFRKG